MSQTLLPTRELSLNRPQLLSAVHSAPIEVDIWSRGTGKSTLFGWKGARIVHDMPRSASAFAGRTFQQLLTRTLPPVIASWERLGYFKDIHYVIGRKPPKAWAEAYQPPLSYEHFISWYTGAGFHLSSQDRAGGNRGLNIDYIMADEGLTLDKVKLETELYAANRGNLDKFSKCPLHHGIHIASSMPLSGEGKWLLDMGNYYQIDGKDYKLIKRKLLKLQLQFIDSRNTEEMQQLWTEIIAINKLLVYYVSPDGVYYNEASIFDNIKNVGLKYIRQQRRTMSDLMFLVEMLNMQLEAVEAGFYPHLDEERQCYDSFDYGYIDGLNFNIAELQHKDCRQDADLDKYRPIDAACDFNASINTLVAGQERGEDYLCLNAMMVKHPLRLKDNANLFCDYYQHHHRKEINFYHDHTAIYQDADRTYSFADKYIEVFESRGWIVNREYIGQAPSHHNRYNFMGTLLKEDDVRLPRVRFNRTNCKYLILSLKQAKVRQGRKGFEKDKRDERNELIDQAETTHFTDAFDTLLWGKCMHRQMNASDFMDIMIR